MCRVWCLDLWGGMAKCFLVVDTGGQQPRGRFRGDERGIVAESEGYAKESPSVSSRQPIIGMTPDLERGRMRLSESYGQAVAAAGGIPLVLCPILELAEVQVASCDGIILTGGDDPIMEQWGLPTHPSAKRVDPARQDFDLAVYGAARNAEMPVLGICLGMQFMGLEAGCGLHQHLPDSLPTAEMHAAGAVHEISGSLGQGVVHSRHHQALRTAGSFEVTARAPDEVIEAIADPQAAFVQGVQWHPERSGSGPLGSGLFEQLVSVASEKHHATS